MGFARSCTFAVFSLFEPVPLMRLSIIFFSLLTILLLGVEVSLVHAEFFQNFVGFALIPAAWSLIWEITALTLTLIDKPFHPGVDIALEIIPWGLGWFFAGVLIDWQASVQWSGVDCDLSFEPRACDKSHRMEPLSYFSSALLLLSGCLHLLIFVIACKATHDRRRAAKKQQRRMRREEARKSANSEEKV